MTGFCQGCRKSVSPPLRRIAATGVVVAALTAADRADIAFTVEDAYQGMGLGGLLLEHLAAAARDRRILRLELSLPASVTTWRLVLRDTALAQPWLSAQG